MSATTLWIIAICNVCICVFNIGVLIFSIRTRRRVADGERRRKESVTHIFLDADGLVVCKTVPKGHDPMDCLCPAGVH